MIQFGRITGGTVNGWRRQISTAGQAKCSKPDCTFTTNQVPEMHSHHSLCVLGGSPKFVCVICKFGPADKQIVVDHCAKMHTIEMLKADDHSDFSTNDDDGDDEEDFEALTESDDKTITTIDESENSLAQYLSDNPDVKFPNKNNSQQGAIRCATEIDRRVLQAHVCSLRKCNGNHAVQLSTKWTIKFRARNYAKKLLYSFAMPSKRLQQLSVTDVQSYENSEFKRSVRFYSYKSNSYFRKFNAIPVKPTNWQQLNLYESCVMHKTSITYCGGPIIAMEWLPLPKDFNDYQMLAICCKQNFQPLTGAVSNATKCLIQMWKIGNLTNTNNDVERAELLYAIAYDEGPIVQMKFCPSGIYDNDRLGLLAVSTNGSAINILSLPNYCDTANNDEQQKINSPRVFVIKPVVRLQLNSFNYWNGNNFITKISWSEVNIIFQNLNTFFSCFTFFIV